MRGAISLREEEPQIIAPLADVLVEAPGSSAKQVERQVAAPLEKLLSQIDGVEHVYSMSWPDHCVVTARAELQRAWKIVDEAHTDASYETLAVPISGRVVARCAEPAPRTRLK